MSARLERQINRVKSAAPAYCEVANDGAAWKCKECGNDGEARDMIFYATPDGTTGVCHLECIDEDWLKIATKVEGKI